MQTESMQIVKHSPVPAPGLTNLSNTLVDAVSGSFALAPMASEIDFYNQYPWALNAFPTIKEAIGYLGAELSKLGSVAEGWQQSEVITNIFLLACSITDTVDDYLAGDTYDFSKIGQRLPLANPGVRVLNHLFAGARRFRESRLSRVRAWSETWRAAVTEFLRNSLVCKSERAVLEQQVARLARLLPSRFPERLWSARPKVPAFFRSRDFTHFDCLELGRKFVACFPESEKPAMVVGLRTAGSFLAPLLSAYLGAHLQNVDWVTIRPRKSLASWEKARLRLAACKRARAVVIDESIHSAQTLASAITLLRQAGFADSDIVVLNPVEPAFPGWKDSHVFQTIPKVRTITLEPPERHKQRMLDSDAAEVRLRDYFTAHGCDDVRVVPGPEVERMNSEWRTEPPERVDVRLKRVYAVHLKNAAGQPEIRHVLAKSVGWGWLGYHAFKAGQALGDSVPPVLGLRDGILYTEWLCQKNDTPASFPSRKILIETVSSYVAARTRNLKLTSNPTPDLVRDGRHKGFEMLANALARAYNSGVAAAANRPRIQRQLSQSCAVSVLTDSKMSADEWIAAGRKLVKADFEHHGQGKNELGMTDPAYDLASVIFHFGFSEEEARQLIRNYVNESGDVQVEERLFLNKLLAGLWAQNLATLGLQNPRLVQRRDTFHQQYISAWNFLVRETVRECGKLCQYSGDMSWRSPLVVLDVDGVLDRMVFGFPATTAAGIKAISLLGAHGFAVALNTARTLPEVKEYCDAYGFVGGVAEYGSIIWDRSANRHLVLVEAESLRQLEEAQKALRQIPGVFLNEDYRYSLRSFTYQNGRTMPLPSLIAQDLLASLKLDRLQVHHTGLDTAITAKETDKGIGLRALLALVGLSPADVLAVGDSEPDLPMFRVAGRSFAPGNISCGRDARLAGCHIVNSAYQPGLLQIAQQIIHPEGGVCARCRDVETNWPKDDNLFVSLLSAADKKPLSLLLQNSLDPSFLRAFRK